MFADFDEFYLILIINGIKYYFHRDASKLPGKLVLEDAVLSLSRNPGEFLRKNRIPG